MAATELTQLLEAAEVEGVPRPERLLELLYDDLRRLAADKLRREPPDHLLQPTALVHEAYMKLVDHTRVAWKGRTHFFAVAAQAMRRILVDEARRVGRDKRGGGWVRMPLEDVHALTRGATVDLVPLHDALEAMQAIDPRMASVAELRLFAGLGPEEVAEALSISLRTVHREWKVARAWLRARLSGEEGP
jgi:RNA polymerase sigma factor (TIGR02999 family)